MPLKGLLGWLKSSRDGLFGTFLVAAVLCVMCSVLVSGAAVGLRATQQRNKDVDRKKNILLAASLCEKSAKAKEVDDIFKESIRETLIDLATGDPVGEGVVDTKKYDARKAAKDPALSTEIQGGGLPGLARREKYASVYEIVDGETVEGYIFPIYGKGLWSTLYGFVALQADGETVRGITFYEHAETPGLGGEVDNPKWKASWKDKTALQNGEVVIQVLKGKVVSDSPMAGSQIDGLSGATITSKGVNYLVRYWLGDGGFGPYLANKTGGNHGSDHGDGHHDDGHDDKAHGENDDHGHKTAQGRTIKTAEGKNRG